MTIIRQYYRQARVSRANDAEWTAENPVLKSGEVGFETNTRMVKVGNGVDAWNSLSYITALAAGGSIAVEDDTVSVDVAANTLDFGTGLDVTDDGGGHLTIDSTGSGATDHGALTGLADDDHPQYLTEAEGDAAYADITEPIAVAHRDDTTNVHDHGQLAGLADDDHPQYETSAEVDTKVATHAGAADPHTGYLKESVLSEANVTDLTDGGETALHSHAGSGSTIDVQEEGVLKLAASALNFDGDDFDIVDAGGGVAAIDVAATHAGSTHSAATDTHIADAADAHDASAISADSTTLVGIGTDVQAVLEELDDAIAAIRALDFLVGTATGELSGEIVAGTAPGGELGGTWASPTVDATHSGSAHHTQSHDHSAAGDGQTLTPATLNIPNAAAPAPTTEGQAAWDNDDNYLRIGDGAASKDFFPTVDATSDPLAVSTAAADGTEKTTARKDHVHAHEAAHVAHDTIWDTKGDIVAATAADTATKLAVGANGSKLTPKSGDATGVAWVDDEFTVGGVLLDPTGARTIEVWRAPFACEVMGYRARVVGGTNAVTNAQVDSSDILTGDLTTTPADSWEAGTIVSSGVEDIAAGEVIKLEVVSISGAVTEISWTILLRKVA